MKTYTDRIVLVFPIADKSRAAAASLQTLTVLDNGREIEDLIPLDPAKVADYASEFNLPIMAENERLTQQLKDAETSHAETVAAMQAEIERLTSLVPKPLGPRQTTAEDFFGRFSSEDVMAIMQNKDPRVVLAVVSLFVRSEAIDLDSQRLRDMIDGLIESGVHLDENDLARIFA